MSRIGRTPVTIPEGVDVKIEKDTITVKGKLGELSEKLVGIDAKEEDGEIHFTRPNDKKLNKSKHGLYRALVQNMVVGVVEGYTKKLEMLGVGYRASVNGQKLDLVIGFAHNIVLEIAPEVKVEAQSEKGKNPLVTLTSIDKQLVGQVAAKIRSLRPPEPYKGKGIRYVGEDIRRKTGKSA